MKLATDDITAHTVEDVALSAVCHSVLSFILMCRMAALLSAE
jgi:hypothetical protein